MSRVLISDLFPGNTGDMIYNNGNNWVRLTKGLTSQVLTLNSEGLPEWGSGSSYITSISDTSDINLDVNAGELTASFANNNISQFTNDAGYLTTTGITPASLTKTDDTNVTLTLGGTPTNSLLQAVSLTLGWTGTLADSRIASAAIWNAKQNALTNPITGTGTSNEIAYFPTTSTVGSLNTATYPSLTELSYIKGLTSSVQTQITNNIHFQTANINNSVPASSTRYITIGQSTIASTEVATMICPIAFTARNLYVYLRVGQTVTGNMVIK